ncbi:MAG: hypothetical protein IPN15_20005 [Saprospiraceae bacterium]|nr:hypothetical protein [Candidatus Vicinibacter affinis]
MKSNLKPDVVELNKTRQLNIIEWEDKILILLSVNEILNLAIDKKHINFFSDICTVVKERFLKSGSCIVFLSYYSIDVKNEGSVDRLSSLIQKVLVGIFRNYNFKTFLMVQEALEEVLSHHSADHQWSTSIFHSLFE